MHSFSYNSHNLVFNGSKIYTVETGLVSILTSHILTVKKSLANIYLPLELHETSLIL